jgi:E3 ubiquitin-protein ligase DOA10
MIGNDEESLIQPCRCSTSYVHESCLQKWRNVNTGNEKYIKCEICNEYSSYTNFPNTQADVCCYCDSDGEWEDDDNDH